MNKMMKTFFIIFAAIISLVNLSCDKINTFPLNIPFSFPFTIQGSNNPATSSSQYCLSQSSTYQSYGEKMKKLTFIEAAWRTDSVKNITLGTLKVTVKIVGGAILFQKTLPPTNPAVYKSTPYVLSLTAAEIQALTNYFTGYLQNTAQCLEASIEATVTSGTIPYYLKGYVDMVVESETKF